jgi:citrate lyase beta subunit
MKITNKIIRQSVHVVYGGAHIFKYDAIQKLGRIALHTLTEFAGDHSALAKVLGINETYSETVYNRVIQKLKTEPVEDFRIDFEDGYGVRSDKEEDESAETSATETAKAFLNKSLSPFFGIRIKPLSKEFSKRAKRTLNIFLTTFVKETKGKLPDNFLVTLPKVTSKEEVKALIEFIKAFEKKFHLKKNPVKIEVMVETPEILFDRKGVFVLPSLVKASEGRLFSAHFGAYDFTSSLDITAKHQTLDHPYCDYVRSFMKVAFADSGVFLSDGATNILPVPKFKGDTLTEEQKEINMQTIHNAWKKSYGDIRRSLSFGFYQGWDLHPAQIPVRYAAVYSFFLEELESATERLKGFIDKAATVSLAGNVFDDVASAQALLNFFVRGFNCGAITGEEAEKTGLTVEELQTKSFLKIIEARNEK